MNCPRDWPEPIVRVQSLSDSGLGTIPDRYRLLDGGDGDVDPGVLEQVSEACRSWGFFQVVNHGVRPELMDQAREVWREFFHQPMDVKTAYANSPTTYEGYGSRLGVEKGAILDWSDYYFLHYLPSCLKDHNKWPAFPSSLRGVIEEYSEQVVKLCGRLMKILSINLGLDESCLQNAFGGEDIGACLRINFYPKCPQPDLTLGLSSHSDPGGLTILLPDQNVAGLQVRRNDQWITVKPAQHAFIVNIGDQVQVLSNAVYKSVEHRVIVNSNQERVSLAYFYNPRGELLVQPMKELVTPENPPLYPPMTFNEYRLYIRTKGPRGKSQLAIGESSAKSPR
nr:flavonol synthase/flavanone 3-hydroxylase-like [Ipomoea trifida]